MKFDVTDEEVGIIGLALQKLPYEQVALLILKLNQQIQEQTVKAEIQK